MKPQHTSASATTRTEGAALLHDPVEVEHTIADTAPRGGRCQVAEWRVLRCTNTLIERRWRLAESTDEQAALAAARAAHRRLRAEYRHSYVPLACQDYISVQAHTADGAIFSAYVIRPNGAADVLDGMKSRR